MSTITTTPLDTARRAVRNSAKVGDVITYRDALGLSQAMTVESVQSASDRINKVYGGYGKRLVHSRNVTGVKHA